MAGQTKVNSTNYAITGGKTRVNGTVYNISGGKTRVNSTVYDISFRKNLPELLQTITVVGVHGHDFANKADCRINMNELIGSGEYAYCILFYRNIFIVAQVKGGSEELTEIFNSHIGKYFLSSESDGYVWLYMITESGQVQMSGYGFTMALVKIKGTIKNIQEEFSKITVEDSDFVDSKSSNIVAFPRSYPLNSNMIFAATDGLFAFNLWDDSSKTVTVLFGNNDPNPSLTRDDTRIALSTSGTSNSYVNGGSIFGINYQE